MSGDQKDEGYQPRLTESILWPALQVGAFSGEWNYLLCSLLNRQLYGQTSIAFASGY